MIVHFVHNLENYSGAAFQALSLCKDLHRRGAPVKIINKSKTVGFSSEKIDGIDVFHVGGGIVYRAVMIFWFFLINRIKIVHIHGYEDAIFIISKFFQKEIVLKSTIDGEDFETLSTKRGKLILRLLSSVSYNNALNKNVYDINKNYTKNIGIIPNFVDVGSVAVSSTKNNLDFVIVGAVCPRKRTFEGIEFFIRNYGHINDSILRIIGPFDDSFSEYDEEYSQKCLARVEGIDNISFSGKLSQNDVLKIMSESIGMIFLSEREGMPNVVLESFATNCVPICSSHNSSLDGLVIDRENGYLVDDQNDRIGLDELIKLCNSGNLILHSKNFCRTRVVNAYIDVYKNYCGYKV